MKRVLSFFAFKRLDGMISIFSLFVCQIGAGTFPSEYFIPLRTFSPDTNPAEISPIEQFPLIMMRNEVEILYCIVYEQLYSNPLSAVSPQRRFKAATKMFFVLRRVGGGVVIDAAIGAHGRGSRPVHYLTVAATLDKSLTSHCL